MNIFNFFKKFPDEQSCRTHLKELRLKEGVACKNCQSVTKHYWLNTVEKFQCSVCNSRTNLKARTIMQDSKLPIQQWFMCIHLMTTTKKPFSALELQRQLGFKRYEPVWDMMRKIRLSMGHRERLYTIGGEIEIDDAFFEVVDLAIRNDLGEVIDEVRPLTRGRGSERQAKVLVMCESKPREQTKHYRKDRELGYVRMVVMDDLKSVSVNYEIQKYVDPTANLISDAFRGYSRLNEVVNHYPMIVKPGEAMKKLPWVHTVIANCKRELLGTHHSIGRGYLQSYLNEFCYKLNRRNFETDLFDRLLLCTVSTKN